MYFHPEDRNNVSKKSRPRPRLPSPVATRYSHNILEHFKINKIECFYEINFFWGFSELGRTHTSAHNRTQLLMFALVFTGKNPNTFAYFAAPRLRKQAECGGTQLTSFITITV